MFTFILSKIFWWSVAILTIPTTLMLVSWNAVPGDSTYKIKVGLEQVILGAAPSPNLKSTLQIKYTEKRFNEVQKVLSTSHASESLDNFNNQLIASENSVKEIKNTEEKKIQTQNLIKTLEDVSQKIEQESQSYSTPTVVVTPNPTNVPTAPIPTIYNKVEINTPTRIITNIPIQTSQTTTSKNTSNTSTTSVPSPTKVVTIIPTKLPPTATPTDTLNKKSDPNIPDKLEKTKEKINETIKELKKSQEQEQNKDNDKTSNNSNKSDRQENQKQNNQSRSKP